MVGFSVGAISTAEWKGVLLADVLEWMLSEQDQHKDRETSLAGHKRLKAATERGMKHVQFTGAEGLSASIPVHKLLMVNGGDVLLAYEMNGESLPPQHGYPLRVVVPGVVGIRNVKWVTHICLSPDEAPGIWQRGIKYKGFGPSTTGVEGIDTEKIPSLQEMPVQSAITHPENDTVIAPGPGIIKGYAYSGGGRGIVRVDVSIDGGETWSTAKLGDGSQQPLHRAWAWTRWECAVDVPSTSKPIQIVCRATDAAYNVQPDTVEGIWNIRGILNNAWHRVTVSVKS